MFPFDNNNSNLEPLFRKPTSFHLYDETQNPNPKHHESPFFSNFPSPFFDEHKLPLNQIFQTDEKTSKTTKKESSKLKNKTDDQQVAAPRKRTGKKDRHSKICTAQGIRDRRMRLSLQVARKFFDLQDMLGYDKASKTIEWLFNKSKKAINELAKDYNMSDSKSESFVSECEIVSETEENSNNEVKEDLELSEINQIKSPKKLRKSGFKPDIRDSKEKARARARSRTEEKLMGKRVEDSKEMSKSSPNCGDLDKLVFEDAGDYSRLVYQPSDVGTIEKLMGNPSSSASNYPISCYIDPNWDCLLSNDRLNYAVTNCQASIAGNLNSIYSDSATDFPLFHQ